MESLDEQKITGDLLVSHGFKADNYGVYYIPIKKKVLLWAKKYNGKWDFCVGEELDNLIEICRIEYFNDLKTLYFPLTGKPLIPPTK